MLRGGGESGVDGNEVRGCGEYLINVAGGAGGVAVVAETGQF
ncbi:hypothetical protein ACWDQ0_32995 [Streptomyces sp. NPDC003642]